MGFRAGTVPVGSTLEGLIMSATLRGRGRALIRGAIVAASSTAIFAVGINTAQAAPSPGSAEPGELAWCANPGNWQACAAGQDAANWAWGTALWLYPDTFATDGRGDAFRHCLWSGATAQRVGENKALELTTNHEKNARDQVDSSRKMDLKNNATGAALGARSNQVGGSDTWGWILNECRARADAGQLAGPNGVPGV